MKNPLCACVFLLFPFLVFSQAARPVAEKYPSLLWEISGRGMAKPSYLFGTMHVSSKMVFNLSDSFYLGIRNAQVVALETNPGNWQEDFSRYDLEGASWQDAYSKSRYGSAPQDYLTIGTFRLAPFEKAMATALYSNPSILNSFLYRASAESGSDFEEDTYLDLHIYQAGRKLGKKVCGVEDFHGSMRLVKEAYADAAKEKKTNRRYTADDEFSYARLEEAYRTGNLDLLDTINKVNSQSAAFDEKFLYRRNEIQAASIDSILKSGASLFVGVGAAHLPGQRGVIEMLRSQGYSLRPIKMKERDSHHKENIERIRVPVQFSRQVADDGFYSLSVPGRLYGFGDNADGIDMKQYADMINGSYYMVTRVATNAAIQGLSEARVQQKLDSLLYENIPGRILSKKTIVRNGYHGYDITNRTRRGDIQRYNIFVTPFEVIIFKMSGNGNYVRQGTEAQQFFNSIQLKETRTGWKKWSPSYGGFEADFPHPPLVLQGRNRVFAALDKASGTAVNVVRAGIHNHEFVEEDSFDINLVEESFASSALIDTCLSRQWTTVNGYRALDAVYRYKDSGVAAVRFLVRGPHYYAAVATAKKENQWMKQFLQSFRPSAFLYGTPTSRTDTALKFTVQSPVPLEKQTKLTMYPEEAYGGYDNADDTLIDNGTYRSRLVADDSTGESIYVSLYRHSQYYHRDEAAIDDDSTDFYRTWTVRRHRTDSQANGLVVTDYELGNQKSSRVLRVREIGRDGMGYRLEALGDTLSGPGAFVRTFFETFTPADTFQDRDVKKKKSDLFFTQFFSTDTLEHKRAVKNIQAVAMDNSDFPQLRKAIASLNWKEKAYLDVKKSFIGRLAFMPASEVSDYLQTLYTSAGDTLELQYTALETLLRQRTAYAYRVFGQIMQNDPPVLNLGNPGEEYRVNRYGQGGWRAAGSPQANAADGSFFDNLTDSLHLTVGIVEHLLPLMNLDDYEAPVMALAGTLVDSSLLRPAAYEAYLPRLILEAKQTLKKQLIREKSVAIEKRKAGEEESEMGREGEDVEDFGNQRLSLYATLLLPFWDSHPQVQPLLQQLLQSSDKRLRYNTALLLLRHNRPVPDSVLQSMAALDEFRWELYNDLKRLKKQDRFPAAYATQLALAKARLLTLQDYGRPDTLVFLGNFQVVHKGSNANVYVFKYREKMEEGTWKLATAGPFPADSTSLGWPDGNAAGNEQDFTRLTTIRFSAETAVEKQVQDLHKRLRYSLRPGAARFYEEDNGYGYPYHRD